MKYIVAFFLITVVCVTADKTPITLCGGQLAAARELLCYGAENVTPNKRGSSNNMIENSGDKSEEMGWPWAGRRGALTANWSRYKRGGLVDECCLKPCTTEVILDYC